MDGMKLGVLAKKGTVTIPHPKKDFPIRTIKSIFKQAGINNH